jgi:hypothetical protein
MKDIRRIDKVVRHVLTTVPETRNSDDMLWVKVIKVMSPDAANLPFQDVMCRRKELGVPCFESVRRTRQKLQAQYKELRATEAVTEGRYEAFKEVLDYVTE